MSTTENFDIVNAIADGMGILQATLTRKALSDSAFRERLQAEPRLALTEIVGRDLPPELVVNIHENGPAVLHIVLPPVLAQTGTLDDEELEAVVGGVTPLVSAMATVASVTIVVALTSKIK